MGLLDRAGARLTAHPEEAEILVVNTCSLHRHRQAGIRRHHPRNGPPQNLRLGAQSSSSPAAWSSATATKSSKSIPEVDAVVGTGELESILEAAGLAIARRRSLRFALQHPHRQPGRRSPPRQGIPGRHRTSIRAPASRPEGDLREQQGRFRRDDWQGATHLLPTYLYDETTPRFLTTPKSSAYIKIAEGCDHPCTFCVIPNLRGKFRSRRFESVVAEAQQLVARGVQEITLIGQDTTCYGEDLGLKDGLATLLDALARIEGLRWLRFLYAYPNRITGRCSTPSPATTTSANISTCRSSTPRPPSSRRMKRGAGADIFLKTLEKVRAAVPGIALRTSFIVGFPGESVRDFELLEEFINEAKFDWLGVFSYSDEEGSAAFSLDGKAPQAHHRSPQAPPDEAPAVHLASAPSSSGSAASWSSSPKAKAKKPRSSGKAAPSSTPPKSTAKSTSTTSAICEALEPGRFYRAEITEAHDYDVVARILSGP